MPDYFPESQVYPSYPGTFKVEHRKLGAFGVLQKFGSAVYTVITGVFGRPKGPHSKV
jgi:hypothetical protein